MPFRDGPARQSSSGRRDGRGGIRFLSSWLDTCHRPSRCVRRAPGRARNPSSPARSSRVAPPSSEAASVDSSSPQSARGRACWANETVSEPAATNATWLAVLRAAQANGIALASTWYADLAVAISDLDNRRPPAGFIGFFEWNRTGHVWDLAPVGISGLVVSEGDAIALYNAGFDSHTFGVRPPVPTLDDPLPSIEFRGDLANSGASNSRAPDAPIAPIWDRNTGAREIGATPAVAYGKLFITTMHGLFALDARDGLVVWTAPGARGFSSPAIFDNSVIVGTSNGTVIRLNASTGSVQWETPLLAHPLFSGIRSSPKVAFDQVFVGTFNESGGSGEVVALWVNNGSVAWRHPTGSVHYSSAAYGDGSVYVGIMGTYNTTSQVTFDPPYGARALNATTGEESWFFPTAGSVAASPAIAGPRLIAPAKGGNVYAIDRATGTLDWQALVDAGTSSPAVHGDTVLVGGGAFGGNGLVVPLVVTSGARRWSFAPNGPVQASITYAYGEVVD